MTTEGDRPWPHRVAVHLPQGGRDPRFGEATQQPRLRAVPRNCPERLDQQYLNQARQNEVTADLVLPGLVSDKTHQLRQPRLAAYMDHPRQ